MKTAITSMLVDIDALAADHPALDQAIRLAMRCHARVKIVDILPWVPSRARSFVTPDLENEIIEHRRGRLEAIAGRVKDVPVKTQLLRGRPATALIQEVLREDHDLVVRSHGRDLAESPRPFGAVDMELLRQCPCPVWLINRRGSQLDRWRILAAVHSNPDDETEQALNASILDWAQRLKTFGDAELTVLQAWTPYGASVLKSHMPSDEFAQFIEETRSAEKEALSSLLASFKDRLGDVAVELVYGEPEDAIAQFVESRGIDTVVMGTVARTGIAGLVIGNTAERVLQRLRCSVLAVKPPGFQSPLEPR